MWQYNEQKNVSAICELKPCKSRRSKFPPYFVKGGGGGRDYRQTTFVDIIVCIIRRHRQLLVLKLNVLAIYRKPMRLQVRTACKTGKGL